MTDRTLMKETILSTLKEYFHKKADLYKIDMAFLYGSWAYGFPREDSDVDMAILFQEGIEREDRFDKVTTISLELTEILRKEVSVLSIEEEFPKPVLYYNAIVRGIGVFLRDFTRYVDLKLSAIREMEDFSIFGIPWQEEIVRKRVERLCGG